MDRSHEAVFHAKGIIQYLYHRCQAVCGARGVGNDLVRRLKVLVVYAKNYHVVYLVLRRNSKYDFFRARLKVKGYLLFRAEDAC